jgi:hypothetical protein
MLDVLLANLKDKAHAANGLTPTQDASWVRDRWNQRAMVNVTDAGPAIFVSDSLLNVWRRANAKLGNATGDQDGPDYVIPQT